MSVTLITGGSRGIGAATAELLASEGHDVCLSYRENQEAAESVVQRIAQNGGNAIAIRSDVSSEEQVESLFRECRNRLGALTGLVNNAGILETQQRVDAMSAARLSRVLSVDVIGAFLCAREAVRCMSTLHGGAGGAIVNVSSLASRLGAPGEYVDYAASKGAVDTPTLGLSKEVASEGIRVNAVRPGLIYTDIHASGGEPGRVDRLAAAFPMKRGGYPQEVAQAIGWLLSGAASYTTGTFIEVAGGR